MSDPILFMLYAIALAPLISPPVIVIWLVFDHIRRENARSYYEAQSRKKFKEHMQDVERLMHSRRANGYRC